jgi:membrane protease YdiL (CAAX protease family)
MGDSIYGSISSQSMFLLIMGLIGYIGSVAIKLKRMSEENNPFKELIGVTFRPSDIDQLKWGVGCVLSFMLVQIVVLLLQGLGVFGIAAVDVYAYFISAAVVEEIFYRMFIVYLMQYILIKMLGDNITKYFDEIIIIFLNGIIFMAVHTRYYGTPAMLIMFLGGVSQTFFFLKTKSILPCIVAHVLINFLASGSLLQTL